MKITASMITDSRLSGNKILTDSLIAEFNLDIITPEENRKIPIKWQEENKLQENKLQENKQPPIPKKTKKKGFFKRLSEDIMVQLIAAGLIAILGLIWGILKGI
jgi:hypothetical protein